MTLEEQRTAAHKRKEMNDFHELTGQMERTLEQLRGLDDQLTKNADINGLETAWTQVMENVVDRSKSWDEDEDVGRLGHGDRTDPDDPGKDRVVMDADAGARQEGQRRITRDPDGVLYRERLTRSVTEGFRWEQIGLATSERLDRPR